MNIDSFIIANLFHQLIYSIAYSNNDSPCQITMRSIDVALGQKCETPNDDRAHLSFMRYKQMARICTKQIILFVLLARVVIKIIRPVFLNHKR